MIANIRYLATGLKWFMPRGDCSGRKWCQIACQRTSDMWDRAESW